MYGPISNQIAGCLNKSKSRNLFFSRGLIAHDLGTRYKVLLYNVSFASLISSWLCQLIGNMTGSLCRVGSVILALLSHVFQNHSKSVQSPEIYIYIYTWTSRYKESRSLSVGTAFVQKLYASKNYAELYTRDILGRSCQKALLLHFESTLCAQYQDRGAQTTCCSWAPLLPCSSYERLHFSNSRCLVTKILVPLALEFIY